MDIVAVTEGGLCLVSHNWDPHRPLSWSSTLEAVLWSHGTTPAKNESLKFPLADPGLMRVAGRDHAAGSGSAPSSGHQPLEEVVLPAPTVG